MTADGSTIRILIAYQQALLREAVRVVLSSEDDLAVVGEAPDGKHAIVDAERLRPDVALIDVHFPTRDGIRAVRAITEAIPSCRIIVFSAEEDEQLLIEAMEAGASGYLLKESPLVDLIAATRAVHRGEALVPPMMLGTLLHRLIQRRRERDEALRRMAGLTRREREVLALLADGGDNETIADRLFISPETARTHIQNVLGKLRVHSRLEAASFVNQSGIFDDLVAVS